MERRRFKPKLEFTLDQSSEYGPLSNKDTGKEREQTQMEIHNRMVRAGERVEERKREMEREGGKETE